MQDQLFRYVEVEREGDMAIFAQEDNASGHVRYEVVLIREGHSPNGTPMQMLHALPPCPTFPEAQALAATWRQELAAGSTICAWCGARTASLAPVIYAGQTAYCCSEDHQRQLVEALT
jgi:hypothetical protein